MDWIIYKPKQRINKNRRNTWYSTENLRINRPSAKIKGMDMTGSSRAFETINLFIRRNTSANKRNAFWIER